MMIRLKSIWLVSSLMRSTKEFLLMNGTLLKLRRRKQRKEGASLWRLRDKGREKKGSKLLKKKRNLGKLKERNKGSRGSKS